MTSFIHANLGSDSESDDADYDPTKDGSAANVSEEEDSDGAAESTKKKKKNLLPALGKRSGGLVLEGDVAADEESENRKNEFEAEKIEKKEMEEQKKVDDLWADFKKDVGSSKPKTVTKPKPVSSGLGSWSVTSKKTQKKKVPSAPPKKVPTNIFDSIFDTKDSTEEPKPAPISSIISSIFEKKESLETSQGTEEVPGETALAQTPTDGGATVTIKKVYDFAGEAVEVTKQVSADSKEAKRYLKDQEKSVDDPKQGQKRPGGLNSIMGVISGKKPKLGTLDKSKMDWNNFVEEEGIKEELQTFNRGKDGYVEKQLFLERADLRRFEIEKEAREKSRKTLNR